MYIYYVKYMTMYLIIETFETRIKYFSRFMFYQIEDFFGKIAKKYIILF